MATPLLQVVSPKMEETDTSSILQRQIWTLTDVLPLPFRRVAAHSVAYSDKTLKPPFPHTLQVPVGKNLGRLIEVT